LGFAPETNVMERREAPFQAGRNARYLKPKGNDDTFYPDPVPGKSTKLYHRALMTKFYAAS
jgi:hypothetical protein